MYERKQQLLGTQLSSLLLSPSVPDNRAVDWSLTPQFSKSRSRVRDGFEDVQILRWNCNHSCFDTSTLTPFVTCKGNLGTVWNAPKKALPGSNLRDRWITTIVAVPLFLHLLQHWNKHLRIKRANMSCADATSRAAVPNSDGLDKWNWSGIQNETADSVDSEMKRADQKTQ